jgi:two-component system sensor histidine kinase ChiS
LCTVQNNEVVVHVQDSDVGIPQNHLQSIFDSFEQVNGDSTREYSGTGLGLSITKKLQNFN